MSRRYKIVQSEIPHFVSFAVVEWMDVFTRVNYVEIFKTSLSWCVLNKGLILNAWCIMPNHVHLIIRSEKYHLSAILRDLKKFTSVKLLEEITLNPQESRKQWMLNIFEKVGRKNSNNSHYHFWQQNNQPIECHNDKKLTRCLNYLHMNPVQAGFVDRPEDWTNSSARQYAGMDGPLKLELIDANAWLLR